VFIFLIVYVGVRGRAAGTAYFIPARVGVWLVWCGSWGPVGESGLSSLTLRGSGVFRGTFRESPFTDTAETSILPAIRPETGTPTSSSPWEPPGLRQEERAASFTPPQALELRWPIRIARGSPYSGRGTRPNVDRTDSSGPDGLYHRVGVPSRGARRHVTINAGAAGAATGGGSCTAVVVEEAVLGAAGGGGRQSCGGRSNSFAEGVDLHGQCGLSPSPCLRPATDRCCVVLVVAGAARAVAGGA
jgi:hypothetical protein